MNPHPTTKTTKKKIKERKKEGILQGKHKATNLPIVLTDAGWEPVFMRCG